MTREKREGGKRVLVREKKIEEEGQVVAAAVLPVLWRKHGGLAAGTGISAGTP